MAFCLGDPSVFAMFIAWGGVLGPGTISVLASDYWPDSHLHCDITRKD